VIERYVASTAQKGYNIGRNVVELELEN
jgi:hypothetical protein